MEKECRNCRVRYNFCETCAKNRPFLNRFCSIKCKVEFEERKQKNK